MKRHLTYMLLLFGLCLLCISCIEQETSAHETETAAESVSASVTEPTAEAVTETTAVTYETEAQQDDISLTSPDGQYRIDLLEAEPDTQPLPDGGTAYSIRVTEIKTQITFDAINAKDIYMQPENFTWSPDGTYLAFEDNRDPENNRICVITPAESTFIVLPSYEKLKEGWIRDGVDLGYGKVHLSTLRQSVLSWDGTFVCVAMQTRIGDTVTVVGFYRYYLPGDFGAQVTMTYLPPPPPTDDPLRATIDESLITVTREYLEAPMNLDPAQIFAEPSGTANQILCLGTAAVPYLEEIADTEFSGTGYNGVFETRRHLARYLSCMIDPDAYRAEYPSPDGRYSVVCQPDMQELPSSFYKDNTFKSYTVTLLDRESGAALPLPYSCFRPIAKWSPDSRYAAMSYGDGVYTLELLLLGTEPLCEIPLPTEEDYKVLLADIIPAGLDNFFFPHMAVEEWLSDDRVKLRVGTSRYGLTSTDSSVTYDAGGYYVYDMKNKTVTETDIQITKRAYDER